MTTSVVGPLFAAKDWGNTGKRVIDAPANSKVLPRPDNLYAHMTFKPLSSVEAKTLSRNFDDSRSYPRCGMMSACWGVVHPNGWLSQSHAAVSLSQGLYGSHRVMFRRRTVPMPGTEGVGKGPDMLHHVPGQRVGMYVPYAGLAQTPLPGKPAPPKTLRRAAAASS